MKKLLNDFIKNEDGVTAIEYALIGVAMATVLGIAISGENGMKAKLHEVFGKITGELTEAAKGK
ncbi:Flp family type IVb pilin [Vibrio europaeus]|uniref:Flp family type IVb pilin n=1 Tax=Vibrio europaeus TaxID=300876 RepID=UPI00233E5C15|nr:Flp family type IVb pilin [Vibrio europaeus]MDC5818717.1 Flp family type IVb pilin [Vibrio europaeus]MDC5871261.1 Flp family type IVb pilin [Vibrio europaeus]